MPLAGFEPTIPVFKRAKTFHALDREATVTGQPHMIWYTKMMYDNIYLRTVYVGNIYRI
jgi:hypothetical protein